jgi:RHS repeat-associated protein
LVSVTDALNNVTTYAYDTEDNLTNITDSSQHTTYFTYDAFGRVTNANFPSTMSETYAYDADNNLTSKTDRKGQTIQYMYDALDRLTQKLYPDTTTVDYVYDLVGKIQQVNDPTGTYAFAYDNMGRLIGTTTSYSFLTGRNFTTSYTYDAASNRAGFTDPEGGSTAYTYDTLNRLATLVPPAAFGSGSFGFSYDALGRRTQMTRPNNVTTSYTYDNLSRLLSVLHQAGGSTIDGSSYTVDNAGNRTAKTDQATAVTSNYTYDAIYQLTQVTQGGNTTESYTYDPVGNRLSSLGVSPYVYNPANELTSTSSATYSYDYNGNTTSKTVGSDTTNYSWDYENRLTSVTLPNSGGTVYFKYDPMGRRIYKALGSAVSVYAYDGDNLIEETDGSGSVVARYAQGLNMDEPLAMLRSSATSYYNVDGLGSVTSLANGSGTLTQTYTYDSFGKVTGSSGSLVNPFQYTGREADAETGLYYYRARYYDPSAGRFLSEDESQFAESSNFYSYVGNDPTNLIDDTGFRAKKPDNLPLGTPKKYWKPFARGQKEALKRLNNKKCADLFESPCHEGPDSRGANQMNDTEYRFVPLPQGTGTGAQTEDSTHVQVNSLGAYLTATSGRIRLPDGSTFDLGSARNVQAMILLHELGHQLSDETGFTPDLDAATNAAHTKRIIDACFQKAH